MHLSYPSPDELREAGGQPTKSGKQYKSLPRARAVAEYINRFGVQSLRYEWRIAERSDGAFELWRFTRKIESVANGIQYHVHFANGEGYIADSLEAAQTHVMQKTKYDQAPPGLLPAEIWEVGPNDVGTGRLVDRITA